MNRGKYRVWLRRDLDRETSPDFPVLVTFSPKEGRKEKSYDISNKKAASFDETTCFFIAINFLTNLV
jgi:hypothetical protein